MFYLMFTKIRFAPFIYPFLKWRLYGKENKKQMRKRGALIVANHTSRLDVLMLNLLFFTKKIYFLGASRMCQYGGFIGWFLKTCGSVHMGSGGTELGAIGILSEKLKKGGTVCVFPEGKISFSGIDKFNNGAAMLAHISGADVLPIYIEGNFGFFRRSKVVVGELIPNEKLVSTNQDEPFNADVATKKMYETVVALRDSVAN